MKAYQDPASGYLLVTGAITAIAAASAALTASAPATYAVTTTSAAAVAANASRRGMVITNVGAATVFIGIGAAAEDNKGIALAANGVWTMDTFTFTVGEIRAKTAAGTSTLAIQEFI